MEKGWKKLGKAGKSWKKLEKSWKNWKKGLTLEIQAVDPGSQILEFLENTKKWEFATQERGIPGEKNWEKGTEGKKTGKSSSPRRRFGNSRGNLGFGKSL